MALTSPGVQVSVIDESYYVPAQTGTTPLIVIATAQNKTNASGTGTAQGTLKANAGKAYKIGSQRELVDTFGVPAFKKTTTGSPIHGSEQNEYGLQAAYSFLGVSNAAYVVRADIDLDELTAKETAPGAEATDGQWWLDTASTLFGVFEWDGSPVRVGGQKFNNKIPKVLTSADTSKLDGNYPALSFGVEGDYAVVAKTDVVRLFYKGKNPVSGSVTWELVGTQEWRQFFPAFEATIDGVRSNVTTKNFKIQGTLVEFPAGTTTDDLVGIINSLVISSPSMVGVIAANKNGLLALYTTGDNDSTGADSTRTNAIVLEDGSATVLDLFGIAAGTYYGPELAMSAHTSVPQWKSTTTTPRPTGSVWVKTTDANLGSHWRVKRWNATTKSWVESPSKLFGTASSALYTLDRSGGGAKLAKDTVYVQYNYSEDTGYDASSPTATFRIYVRKTAGVTSIVTDPLNVGQLSAGTYTFTLKESLSTQSTLGYAFPVSVTLAGNTVADFALIAQKINELASTNHDTGLLNVEATYANGRITLTHKLGGEIRIKDTDGLFADLGFLAFDVVSKTGTANLYTAPSGDTASDLVASNWEPLQAVGYVADDMAPLNEPADGQRWYSSRVDQVDIMAHNGTKWVSYGVAFPTTDPAGPIVTATRPVLQSDGTALVTGDIWIDTSDLENYPVIYRYNNDLDKAIPNRWVLVDKSDSTSEDGIIFADARWATSGGDTTVSATLEPSSIVDLKFDTNSYVDFDAPDPDLYPQGMLLWNTRRSGFNIKRYVENYVDTTGQNTRYNDADQSDYVPARWVTDSGSKFGRHAQRTAVVTKLQALIDTNSDIRETEVRDFDLIACPGYPETIDNLINLNVDRGTTAFVVGDSPLRLKSDNTTLSNWGLNTAGAVDNGDEGLLSHDEYSAVFYPSGYTNDNTGNPIVVPASHMILKTIALSDQVSYPWFAPAGTRRGGITNATSVGYIDSKTSEFTQVSLTESQRDTLYSVAVNPITYFNGIGLVNYGQKTRAKSASALDRINVARLVVYLRKQLNTLAKPYVFEPNDKLTRDEIKQAVESLLLELVGLRAIYDYVVVCDETNNTPSRIDRNELYVDIAIEPVKAIEFIYIPLRLKNTGEIKGAKAK